MLAAYSDAVTTISFAGTTTFNNNHCLTCSFYNGGGAIFSSSVTLNFNETTEFIGNYACDCGGAIHMECTNATFYGVTTFTENLVFDHSGYDGVRVRLTENGVFPLGYEGDGGGMCVDHDSRLMFLAKPCFLEIKQVEGVELLQ